MPTTTEVSNWFGDLVSKPKVVAEAKSIKDIQKIVKDAEKFPSPVRAFGSNHSTAACSAADGGTMIRMKGMNRRKPRTTVAAPSRIIGPAADD